MLKVTNLTKYFGTERIFEKVSFGLDKGHKVALVGFNGTGKTTLLRILAGELEADSGRIETHKNLQMGFLPQDPNKYNNENVLEFLKSYVGEDSDAFLRQVEIMFAGFALPTEIKFKKIGDLSSGQKTKVFLTGLLLKKNDILFLDEPTNNLDLPALIWLEDYLQKIQTPFIVVSHDRKFLDNVTNKIFEIDWHDRNLHVSNGRYSDYLINKSKNIERQTEEHERQKEEELRLRQLAEYKRQRAIEGAKYQAPDNDRLLRGYFRDKAGNSYRDAKVVFNRIKRMEIPKKPNVRKDFLIEIQAENNHPDRDILISDLICGYEDGFRIGPIDMEIKFGDRVIVLGLNGSGKSTFLKTLTNTIPKIEGKILLGEGVKFGNFMQEHETLPKEESVIGFLNKRVNLDRSIIQNHLLHFGFSEWQMKKRIKTLSPGGRARLLLALFAATNVNVLILDEPTNHLDIEAEEALEKALEKFEGTVIIVTHDRYFVEKTKIDSLYLLENSKMQKIQSFTDYLSEMQIKARKLLRMLK